MKYHEIVMNSMKYNEIVMKYCEMHWTIIQYNEITMKYNQWFNKEN